MNKIKAHLTNIAFSHSIFALPFAYMGAFLARGGVPAGRDMFWITVAMVGARSAAMALNNLIDLKYDRLNPRFTKRPMVTGVIKPREAATMIAGSLLVFLLAAAQLGPLCLKLAPLALAPLVVYPYMKRFSWTCHLVLGVALGVAPVGAWVAVRGDFSAAIVLLAVGVCLWIGGFDVIYACQDLAFDRAHNLHSMPVRFGIDGALRLVIWMHAVSTAVFLVVGWLLGLSWLYYLGVLLAAVVLAYQHSIVSSDDFSRVTPRYFMRNGLVSILIFLFTFASLL